MKDCACVVAAQHRPPYLSVGLHLWFYVQNLVIFLSVISTADSRIAGHSAFHHVDFLGMFLQRCCKNSENGVPRPFSYRSNDTALASPFTSEMLPW